MQSRDLVELEEIDIVEAVASEFSFWCQSSFSCSLALQKN